ncbi:MAG: glycoside hydrolase family 13 protein [Erysipelotrichaceae bacterium]
MNKSAIFHLPYDNFAYLVSENQAEIRLKTDFDVKTVTLHYNDPYHWDDHGWVRNTQVMDVYGLGEHHKYFQTTISTTTHRLKYFFELANDEETLYFGEQGFSKHLPENTFFPFFLPYLHQNAQLATVDWVNDAQWYQIFPDRFWKGDISSSQREFTPWTIQQVTNEQHYGGNLPGITQKMPYLKELGINALYLTPIFQANTAHKYDTKDYLQIDIDFGDEEDFKTLVKTAHDHGIRVILDCVFNHSGEGFAPWQDVLAHGKDSAYYNWFHVFADERDLHYEMFAHSKNMPKLNTQNPEVSKYLIGAASYWTTLAPIDGWRLDVANEIDHYFWREFRSAIKAIRPDAYILGEVWHDAKPWLRGDQFDGVMNYPLTHLILKTLQTKDVSYYKQKLVDLQFQYPLAILSMQFNLLDSHDTKRIYTQLGDENLLKIAYILLFSNYGTPCIYYGSEIMMEGWDDPDCRRLMRFDDLNTQETSFKSWMTQLQHIRQLDPAFGNRGIFSFVEDDTLLIYEKASAESTLRFYINLSDKTQSIQATGLDLFQNKIIHQAFDLTPNNFLVLKVK